MQRCIKCKTLSDDSAHICERCGYAFQEQMVPLPSSHEPESIHTNTHKSTQLKKDQSSFLIRLLALLGISYSTQTGKRVIAFIPAIITVAVIVAAIVLGPVLKVYPPFRPTPRQAIAQANINPAVTAQATTQPNEYLLATSGPPTFNDPLSDNGRGNGWAQNSSYCVFSGGAYHVTIAQPSRFIACRAAPTLSNFALQVQMTVLSGDFGGIVFRTSQQEPYGYRFTPRANNGDLVYGHTKLARFSTPISPNQTYLLTVIAIGNNIWLYVDKQLVATVQDSSASSGGFGFMAGDFSNAADVAYTNVQVWTL